MLHIAGGSYSELCSEPEWYQLFGSGLRAAAAVSGYTSHITLHTYIEKSQRINLESLSALFGFSLRVDNRPADIRFYYQHGLSKPIIQPEPDTLERLVPLNIVAANILRFGMLEGDAIVEGERVVYDPQSPDRPCLFRANKSSAKHLAIVANAREVSILSGTSSITSAIRKLVHREGAEVVVVKRGALGATVATKNKIYTVPAYKTNHVWPIGSGDVFSGIFAALWADRQFDAVTAAKLASFAAAYYCNSRSLPIPRKIGNPRDFVPINASRRKQKSSLVYLAGPFFTMGQRWLVREARLALMGQHINVFSPYDDIGPGDAEKVVPLDIKGIRSSSAMLALVDGLDSGTLFEVGYARALGIPVVALVQNETEEAMKMLQGTGCILTSDFVTAIYKTTWAAMRL